MKNLLLYNLENTFVSDQTTAGGDGTNVVSVVDGVAWCRDSENAYYNPNDKEILSHTITVEYVDGAGSTLAPSGIVTEYYVASATSKVILFPKNVDGYSPTEFMKSVYIPASSSATFVYAIPPTGYTKSGLVMQYDGIFNTPTGHNGSSEIWYDLSKNGYHLTHTGTLASGKRYWDSDCFVYQKESGETPFLWYSQNTYPTTGSQNQYWTIEFVARVTTDIAASGVSDTIWSTLKIPSDPTGQYDSTGYGYRTYKIITGDTSQWRYWGNKHYQSITDTGMPNPQSDMVYIARYLEYPYITNDNNAKGFLYSTLDGFSSSTFVVNSFAQYASGSYSPEVSRVCFFGNRTAYDDAMNNRGTVRNNSKIEMYACRMYNRQLTLQELQNNALIDANRFGF